MGKKIVFDLNELESLLCTKRDIEALAITSIGCNCLTWFNEPFCWFEDATPKKRNVYRKMAKQMNFLRKIQGKKLIEKEGVLK